MFHKTDMQRSTVVWWKNHTRSGKLCANPRFANPCAACFETDIIEIAWPQDRLFWFCYPHCRVVRFTSNTRPVSGSGRHLVQCRHQRVCWWPAAGQIVSSKSWDMGPQMEGRFLEANYPCSPWFHQLQEDHPIKKGVLHMAAAWHETYCSAGHGCQRVTSFRNWFQILKLLEDTGDSCDGLFLLGSLALKSWRNQSRLDQFLGLYWQPLSLSWYLVPNDLNHTPHLILVELTKPRMGLSIKLPN